MKLSEIVAAVKGSFGYPADIMIENISTDTRTITKGSVFLALKGARFDGHDYAAKAMELGAEAVITERAVEGAKCIIVDSTAKALLDLAGYYRDKFDIPLVGALPEKGSGESVCHYGCIAAGSRRGDTGGRSGLPGSTAYKAPGRRIQPRA